MDLLLIEQKHCWLTLLLITDNNKRGENIRLGAEGTQRGIQILYLQSLLLF